MFTKLHRIYKSLMMHLLYSTELFCKKYFLYSFKNTKGNSDWRLLEFLTFTTLLFIIIYT